jgi:hypothetical protein
MTTWKNPKILLDNLPAQRVWVGDPKYVLSDENKSALDAVEAAGNYKDYVVLLGDSDRFVIRSINGWGDGFFQGKNHEWYACDSAGFGVVSENMVYTDRSDDADCGRWFDIESGSLSVELVTEYKDGRNDVIVFKNNETVIEEIWMPESEDDEQ